MKQHKYGPYIAAGVTAFCVIAASVLFFFLLFEFGRIWAFFGSVTRILRPIFMGMVLAFLLAPIHRRILGLLTDMTHSSNLKEQRTVRLINGLSILFTISLAVYLVYLLLAMLLPQLYISVVGLSDAFPGYIESFQRWLRDFWKDNPDIQQNVMYLFNTISSSLEQWLNSEILPNLQSMDAAIRWLREAILPNLTGVVSGVSSVVISFFVLLKDLLIALIVSVYLLARKDFFKAQIKKTLYAILPTKAAELILEESRNAYRIMSGFINGKLLDSLIIGIISLVCCTLLKFPYPTLLATVIGVTNIVPFFGPFIGAIPCAVLILLVSPMQCLYFVVFILILQQFDGNILGPKILGDSTGLAAFWVLFSILLFGGLFGFAGMVLGVPVFAMIYSIADKLLRYGLRKKGLPEGTAAYMRSSEAVQEKDGPKD